MASVTFLGPLIGSLIRPFGGALADRVGGAAVTFWNFVGMGVAAATVLVASLNESLPLFIGGFIALFVFAGVGNGSTYKTIPAIFPSKLRRRLPAGDDETSAMNEARRLSGAMIGLAGAVGVLVNAFRDSFLANANAVHVAFIAFYVACFALPWCVYLRRHQARLDGV